MFNEHKLDSIITEYKKQFIQSQWLKEKFKWEAVKCFQDNWDISTDNFTEMLINSLAKTGNLLSSKNNFPKDTIINLSALEYKLLTLFIDHRGKLLTRDQLLDEIWNIAGDFVNDNTVTVYIKRLREKIEDDPTNPKIIKTVRGLGYRMD